MNHQKVSSDGCSQPTLCVSGLPYASAGNGSWQVLKRMLDGKAVIVHGDGTSLWTMTHSTDFAKGFVGLMANPHVLGHAIQITSDESMSWNQIYSCIAQALEVPFRPAYVPSALLAGSQFYDFKGNLLGDKAHSIVFDNAKLKHFVPGFTATISMREGITALVAIPKTKSGQNSMVGATRSSVVSMVVAII
ncbi:MAG: hypothetical protein ACLTDS_16655 [Bianqueaceae bacterium]